MSTLSRPSRLLTLVLPLGLAWGLAGCSSTAGPRTGALSKMKTNLAIGEKPLPVVTGEPGSVVAADEAVDPSPRRGRSRANLQGRISGRVFDTQGRPVPDARVRLAVGGAPGGKDVRAVTDRSGAFTLRGVRPGSSYTLIAEYEGDDGLLTGRSSATASQTDVRISLAASGDEAARAGTSTRVNRVSDREPADDEDDSPSDEASSDGVENEGANRPKGRSVNQEDLPLPPAPEAEAMVDPPSNEPRTRDSTSTRHPSSAQGERWRRGTGEAPAKVRRESGSADAPAPVDPETRGTSAESRASDLDADDGPNPLPPALDPAEDRTSSASREDDPFAQEPPRVATAAPPRAGARRNFTTSTPTRRPAASSPFEFPSRPTAVPAPAAPADLAPGALVVVPESFAPVVIYDADPFAVEDPAPPARPAPRPTPARSFPRTPPRVSTDRTSTAETVVRSPASKPAAVASGGGKGGRRKPTWGEVASAEKSAPPAVGGGVSDPGTSRTGAGVAVQTGAAGVARQVSTTSLDPQCDYDDRLRRINDFRLPDLDGKPVRFRDLDADLVLIDFWGTWCQPCIRSIPHLVDLQERMGKRIKVVGIACEQDSPGQAAPRVAETVRRLKVNYPVLLSRNDGSCPIQEALHIQAFPTMILVDREGRVLWRDQGATPATMARLDRMIATAPKADDTRRF